MGLPQLDVSLQSVVRQLADDLERDIRELVSTWIDRYPWPKSKTEKIWGEIPGGFDPGGYSSKRLLNIALREFLHAKWQKSAGDLEKRTHLAEWIVKRWGGIRGNRASTVKSYLEKIDDGSFTFPFKGVSSYSKIYSVIDPKKYAIYDARVAACLDVIQIDKQSGPKIFFEIPAGRNSALVRFTQGHKKSWFEDQDYRLCNRDMTYTIYMELLGHMAKKSGYSILEIEMSLFAAGPELCAARSDI